MIRWMSRQFRFAAAVTGFLACPFVWADANTRVTNPNAISFELGGRGLLYSVDFDRVLNENLAVGIGVGTVSTNNSTVGTGVIPVYGNYYFSESAGSLFATLGANLITNAGSLSGLNSNVGNVQFTNSPIQLTFGLGYEYRSDPGFLVRVAAYGIYAGNVSPWGGFTIGYSF
jgi:hypothetical protein